MFKSLGVMDGAEQALQEIEAEIASRTASQTEKQPLQGIGCESLNALTWLGKARQTTQAVDNEEVPFEFELISLRSGPALTRGDVKITNISQHTEIELARVSIIAPNGSSWSPSVKRDLKPGDSHVESVWFESGGLDPEGDFESVYAADLSRDFEGVNRLLDDEATAWVKTWPYNKNKEIELCLVSPEHLRELGRTNCPAHATGSTQNTCMKHTDFGIPEHIFKKIEGFTCGEKPSVKNSTVN